MSKTFKLPRGRSIAPMPPLRVVKGEGRRGLPGGLPPVAFRCSTHKWVAANARAAEPYGSRAIRMEVVATRAALG